MRFFLDNDVDVAVCRALKRAGHTCWTAAQAGLSDRLDDPLTIYAHEKRAVLVTHDAEFSNRRRRNVVGHPLQLKCLEWEAADLLISRLPDVIPLFAAFDDVFVVVSPDKVEFSRRWA